MVECRSLIDFCKTYQKHRTAAATNSPPPPQPASQLRSRRTSNKSSHPFCDNHSPLAAIDALVLIVVIGTIGILTIPYFNFVAQQACWIFPEAVDLLGDAVGLAPFAYGIGLVVALVVGILLWQAICHQARKCGKPNCKGLRKAPVAFDIQLEPADCVRNFPSLLNRTAGIRPLELQGHDQKDLEAELKKMAPLNGRTVLIFRAPCGCAQWRMEVWGPKKPRRIKK